MKEGTLPESFHLPDLVSDPGVASDLFGFGSFELLISALANPPWHFWLPLFFFPP